MIDVAVSKVIERIFDECLEGRSASQTAKRLNADGIPSPSAYKRMLGRLYNGRVADNDPIWTASTVLRILQDERYTGKMISNKRETVGISTGKMRSVSAKEWIVVEGTHDAIISQEVFDAAALARSRRVKKINKNTSGDRAKNLFVCGYCGRKLQKSVGTATHLFCTKAGVTSESSCSRLHEPMEDLQGQVLKVVKTFAKLLIEQAAETKIQRNLEGLRLEKKAAETERTLQSLQNGKLDLYEEYRSDK